MKIRTKIFLILFPIFISIIAVGIGRMMISPTDILKILLGDMSVDKASRLVVINMRIPRIFLALLAGAGLSVAGLCFQALFSNPLATPDTVGVASGASFGAVIAILFSFNSLMTQVFSIFVGIVAVFVTWMVAKSKNMNVSFLVLSGIMVGSVFNALISLVKYVADTETKLPEITYWLMGNLGVSNYKNLYIGAPIIIVSIFFVYLMRWRLNLLSLTEEEIISQGINIKMLRVSIITLATMMTASIISMCGQVGWVGLIVPHICKMKIGNNHSKLVPFCISIGASFMVIVDTMARSLIAKEIPISIITALLGAPFFIYLLQDMKRRSV